MKIHLIIVIASILSLSACGNSDNESNNDSFADTNEVVMIQEDLNPHNLILLNNQKWVIDEGMRVSIDSIQMEMDAFQGNDLESYQRLSVELEHHTKSIISSCTMKGQAHDELHKWLIPFIDLRKELGQISESTEGARIVTELNNELIIFKTYFE